ncbi:hypothetical protein HQ535_05235 [bacterium]|nr:hypothetical protein [bacterium]
MDEISLSELLTSPLDPPRPPRAWDPQRRMRMWMMAGGAVIAVVLVVVVIKALGPGEEPEAPPPPEPVSAVRDNPAPRLLAKMVFDTGVGRAVMFGGEIVSEQSFLGVSNETWQYEATEPAWWLLQSNEVPPGRAGPALAFDEQSGVTVMFGGAGSRYEPCFVARWCGGSPFGDTWKFDAAAGRWTEMHPTESPAPRSGHAAAYDPAHDVVVVFGGVGLNDADRTLVLSDTWLYDVDSDTWTEVTQDVAPAGRGNHAMVYDPDSATVLMWGGVGPGVSVTELWSFDGSSSTWTVLNPDAGIGKRLMATAVHASGPGVTVIMGGEGTHEEGSSETGLVFSDEVFAVDGATLVERQRHDPPIWRHSAAYDSGVDRIIVTFLDSTWLYDAEADEWVDVTEQSRSLLGRQFTP